MNERAEVMRRALAEVGVEVWHTTRYANDSGTCLRCVTGTMVMVPDDESRSCLFQADGADELRARVEPVFERLLAEAAETLLASGPRAALLAAGDALRREGYDAGYQAALDQAREVFEALMIARFGALPPAVSDRIRQASFADMHRWAQRAASVRHVTALVV